MGLMSMHRFALRTASLSLGAALLAGMALALGAFQVQAQGPASVPSFRAYGSCASAAGPCAAGTTVTAVSASTPGRRLLAKIDLIPEIVRDLCECKRRQQREHHAIP